MAQEFFSSQLPPNEIDERVEGYASWLEIDLDSISFNVEKIRKHVHDIELIPCVKANAYGHGIVPVVAHLERLGVRRVLVAKLWEALQLRDAGLTCGIINMDPVFTKTQFDLLVEREITQTVFDRATAEKISEAALKLGKRPGVFIKVDTGLGRTGVQYGRAADLIEVVSSLPKVHVDGIFSTFTEEEAFDRVQLQRMLEVDAELKRRGIGSVTRSVASSNAILHFPESYLDAVRPGLTVYGVYPEEEDGKVGLELRQALRFKARLELVKWVDAGDSLTYSRRFVAPKRMRVGTVHAGYSDGYPRGLTNKGVVRLENMFKPVLGTVSVNHHIIDLEDTDAQEGSMVELIGTDEQNTISQLARLAGIMTYSLCVGLNPLTPRVYYENGRPVALSEPKLVQK